jgi:hypothetical protein
MGSRMSHGIGKLSRKNNGSEGKLRAVMRVTVPEHRQARSADGEGKPWAVGQVMVPENY